MPTLDRDEGRHRAQRRFTGRREELAVLGQLIASRDRGPRALYVWGPGGVGKTALIGEAARRAITEGTEVTRLDARDLDPTPEAVLRALGMASERDDGRRAAALRRLLIVDTYERFASIDEWLREDLLRRLPAATTIVLAGRRPPSNGWRAHPAWRLQLVPMQVDSLPRTDAVQLLTNLGVPDGQHEAVLAFTHGHPLALRLAADICAERPDLPFAPANAPDILGELVSLFVATVPSPRHRSALEACAVARYLTESLLAAMLAEPDVYDLFEWLGSVHFVEGGRRGRYPHDAAREVLVEELGWRNPDKHAELVARAHAHLVASHARNPLADAHHVVADVLFVHRFKSHVRPFYGAGVDDEQAFVPATPRDVPGIVAMVARHEGAESSAIAAHWLARDLTATLVTRDPSGAPLAFLTFLTVTADGLTPHDRQIDPGIEATWQDAERRGPLRPGECFVMTRFHMARETGQAPSPIAMLFGPEMGRRMLTTPGIVAHYLPLHDIIWWEPYLRNGHAQPLPEANFVVGGMTHSNSICDMREHPPLSWLALLAIGVDTDPRAPVRAAAARRMPDLADVRRALRDLHRPARLHDSPLLDLPQVGGRSSTRAPSAERVASLVGLLREVVASMASAPRCERLHRALELTYIQPVTKQTEAADRLGVSFSTYRRDLDEAIAYVADRLARP